jgi:hypothetical protein
MGIVMSGIEGAVTIRVEIPYGDGIDVTGVVDVLA